LKAVSFTEMENGTKEDYMLLTSLFEEHNKDFSDRLLATLNTYKNIYYGYKISRYEHSLQCATRAHLNNEEEEMVVSCLFHDIGGELSPYNHGELAAAILKPFVSDKTYWIIKYHPIFQQYVWAHHIGGNRNARDQFRSHPYYQDAIKFCHEYDQNSFDPDFKSLPLDFFIPIIKRVFSKPHVTYKDS
jgi:predicted HD phosphohydrolase